MAKIGIIGAGFGGLAAAYHLKGKDITLIEENNYAGGLSSAIKTKEWEWPVDNFVHHWFANDLHALRLAKELGLSNKLIFRETKSSCFYKDDMAQLDSPISLLKFPFLNIIDRVRMGVVMAKLKVDKNYLRYEDETAASYILKTMGHRAYSIVWEPLLYGKFGKHEEKVSATWFWARVNPRTKKLAYLEGSFQCFADKMVEKIRESGGKVILNSKVNKVIKRGGKFEVYFKNKKLLFDYLILAVPLPTALGLYAFPQDYRKKYESLISIGAQYFILELEKPMLKNDTYWLNINEKDFPFIMIAEHTNFIDKKHYNNKHIVWVGKYLDYDNPLWKLNERVLLKKIIPFLKRINPEFEEKWINRYFFTRVKNAQTIIPKNYSNEIPSIETPVPNLYMANMNQVYPWDRGTNGALEIGSEVARKIKSKIDVAVTNISH